MTGLRQKASPTGALAPVSRDGNLSKKELTNLFFYSIIPKLSVGSANRAAYGEKLALPAEPTRKGAEFLGWFTEPDGGTQITANDVFTETADKTYYAHWEITEVFSVTVPVMQDADGLPLREPRTPQMVFRMQLPRPVPVMSIVRRAVDLSAK